MATKKIEKKTERTTSTSTVKRPSVFDTPRSMARKPVSSTKNAPPSSSVRKTTRSKSDGSSRHREPTHDEIAKRAYAIYERRGRVNGHHEEDWRQAEAELRAEI